MREFPIPDPMLRHMPVEMPALWARLDPQELSLRARYFLIARCAGFPVPAAWTLALVPPDGPQWEHVLETVDDCSDERIEEMVREDYPSDDEGSWSFWTVGEVEDAVAPIAAPTKDRGGFPRP